MDPKQKIEALKSELQQIVKNYQEAEQVMKNCERKIFELRGGIAACEEMVEGPEKKKEEK